MTVDKIVDHSAVKRPRPIERIEGGQIFEFLWPQLATHILHARRFKLENRFGASLTKKFHRLWIVCRYLCPVDRHVELFLHRRQAIADDRERRQPKKIHLEHPDFLKVIHRILTCEFVLARHRNGNKFVQRFG